MERDLHASLATVQWVINAYAVVFGVVIVTGGRPAYMLGRRTVFFVGAGIFAAFSLVGGLAPDAITLIACRAVMGAGGALMWPALMGMTYDLLPEDKAGLAGFGNAVGPLLGGLLTSEFSWRWILYLNLLIAAVAVVATLRYIRPDGPRSHGERLGLPRRRCAHGQARGPVTGAGLLQHGRLGARVTATAGAARMTIGILALSFLQTRGGFGWLVPGMVIVGTGIGLFCSSISTAAITALDPSRASLAGGVVYMCQVGGGSVGLAVNTAIVLAAGPSVTDLVSGIQRAFLVDAALGLLVTAVTVARVGTGPPRHDERRREKWGTIASCTPGTRNSPWPQQPGLAAADVA